MTPGQLCRRSVLAMAAGLPLGMLPRGYGTAAAAPEPAVRYTMSAFTNYNETDLYIYESADAVDFTLLRGPAYRPPTGLLRDPSIFRHTDGAYYLTHTTGWGGQTIGFARSTDRIAWTFLCDYTVGLPDIQHTWAPKWFVDPQGRVAVIVALGNSRSFQPHLMTATDPSLTAWTPLRPLAGLTAAPGTVGYIDTALVQAGGRYYAFTKNESTKYIELAVADSPCGPYRFLHTGDWARWGPLREGPCVIALPDGGWRIYFDAYLDRTYLFSDSHDLHTWTPPRQLPGISGIVRHCTVLPERVPDP
ncbi:glycoside hydrolase [Nocardia terpenica]|nr:glycoside hydrolase [Nocardia terpenica]